MVGKVATIAGNAFRETVRQPVYCIVLGAAAVVIAFSPAFSMFTLMESVKLVQDMGLSTILLAGLFLAVLSASTVVTEEIRGRTALMVVARPVGRGEFVLGKFLGLLLAQAVAAYLLSLILVLTVRVGVPEAVTTPIDTTVIWAEIGVSVAALAIALGSNYFFDKPFPSAVVSAALLLFTLAFFVLAFFDRNAKPAPFLSAMDVNTLRACVVLFPMLAVLTAAAVACATRLNLLLSVLACTFLFIVGILSEYLFGRFAEKSLAAAVPYALLPSFQVFWMGDALSADRVIPWAYVGSAISYGALYAAALLFLGMLLFERREIS
jgi:ABC-type transport system involved in multi-copper enzyme maturation permease subunit